MSNWPPRVDEAAEGISCNVCVVMLVEEFILSYVLNVFPVF